MGKVELSREMNIVKVGQLLRVKPVARPNIRNGREFGEFSQLYGLGALGG